MSQPRRGWVVTEGGSQGVRIFPEGEYPRGVKPLFFYYMKPINPIYTLKLYLKNWVQKYFFNENMLINQYICPVTQFLPNFILVFSGYFVIISL